MSVLYDAQLAIDWLDCACGQRNDSSFGTT
jgi:hypothetical protein